MVPVHMQRGAFVGQVQSSSKSSFRSPPAVWHSSGVMQPVEEEMNQLHASICKGLADVKRLLILNALRDGERNVMDLCQELALPQANVSQHLAVLRDKGLLKARKDGQRVFYSVASPKIIVAMDLLRDVMHEANAATGSA